MAHLESRGRQGALLVEDRDSVRVLRFSNPSKRNALSRQMLAELEAAFLPFAQGSVDGIRCLVITGDPVGGAFSAGFDITAIDEDERAKGLDPIALPAAAIAGSAIPVIAAINGPAFGGAVELACACDLRVISRKAKIGMPPARLGLMYSLSGLSRFLDRVSPGFAARLFLTGQPVGAEEAHAAHLGESVAEPETVLDVALGWASHIAANAPLAVAGMKQGIAALGHKRRLSPEEKSELEALRTATLASDDLKEGVAAFSEKREPDFQGR